MNDYMTPAEFERAMKEIVEKYEAPSVGMHVAMDNLMLSVMRSRGFDAGCDIFEKYFREDKNG